MFPQIVHLTLFFPWQEIIQLYQFDHSCDGNEGSGSSPEEIMRKAGKWDQGMATFPLDGIGTLWRAYKHQNIIWIKFKQMTMWAPVESNNAWYNKPAVFLWEYVCTVLV